MTILNFLQSIFVPDNSLQGDTFPSHLIWDTNIPVSIKIEIPDGISLTELYNVPEDGFTLKKNCLKIDQFKVNGYVGLVFLSKKFSESKIIKNIRYYVTSNGSEIIKEMPILLFRQDFIAKKIPELITITELEDSSCVISDKIFLNNDGLGTAIIQTVFDENNPDIQKLPDELDEFKLNFIKDFNEGLSELKHRYCEYSCLIDDIIELNNDYRVVIIDTKVINKLEIIANDLMRILTEDVDFRNEFFEQINYAYSKNSNFLNEINSFLNYLQSTSGIKIIFPDATLKLRIHKSTKNLSFDLVIIDLAKNEYKPLHFDIPVDINSKNDHIIIQMKQLFSFENENLKFGECEND